MKQYNTTLLEKRTPTPPSPRGHQLDQSEKRGAGIFWGQPTLLYSSTFTRDSCLLVKSGKLCLKKRGFTMYKHPLPWGAISIRGAWIFWGQTTVTDHSLLVHFHLEILPSREKCVLNNVASRYTNAPLLETLRGHQFYLKKSSRDIFGGRQPKPTLPPSNFTWTLTLSHIAISWKV